MKLNIRGEKTEITNSMKEYAEEKIEKLEKYLEKPEEAKCNILFKVRGIFMLLLIHHLIN